MIARLIFTVILVASLFVESSLLQFPFVVLFSLVYFFLFDNIGTYLTILITSLILDSFMLRSVGYTALFLFLFMGTLIALEKLFTIKLNGLIVIGVIILGVEGYRQYVHYPFLLGPELILILGLLFSLFIQRWLSMTGGSLNAQKKN